MVSSSLHLTRTFLPRRSFRTTSIISLLRCGVGKRVGTTAALVW